MRIGAAATVLCLLPHVTLGFLIFSSFCERNDCEKSGHCKGKTHLCQKLLLCRNKICIAIKPKPTIKPTDVPTTTKHPSSCQYPSESEFAKLECTRGHKNKAVCVVSCQVGRCLTGSMFTRCMCNSEGCNWKPAITSYCKKESQDSCQVKEDCEPGYICARKGCSKICIKDCKDSCKTAVDCPTGETCARTSCGRKCKTEKTICPTVCKIGSDVTCPRGFTCQFAKKPCVTECVKLPETRCPAVCKIGSDVTCPRGFTCQFAKKPCVTECVKLPVPKCPVFHPLSGEPLDTSSFCNSKPADCKVDGDCGRDAVCCYSALCKRNMCSTSTTGNNCATLRGKPCMSSANCSDNEICAHHKGGCRICSKGFQCHPRSKSCSSDTDCRSRKCGMKNDGCLRCQNAPVNPPTSPPLCLLHLCSSHSSCFRGDKCIADPATGCKRCQRPPESKPCFKHFCGKDSDCDSKQKCMTGKTGCRLCQTPIPCLGKKCTADSQCGQGLKCVGRGDDCQVCQFGQSPGINPCVNACAKDSDCLAEQKCKVGPTGCRRCQFNLPPIPCLGNKCTTDTDCGGQGQKCRMRGPSCRVCLREPTAPSICGPGRRCIDSAFCEEGEVCVIKGPGCRVCDVRRS